MDAAPPSSLLSRLNSFLPAIASANSELDKAIARGEGAKYSIEAVDSDDERVIEMNLGLGVLEEKRPGVSDSEGSSDWDSSDCEDARDSALSHLLSISKNHGNGPRRQVSIQELELAAGSPTPARDKVRRMEMGKEQDPADELLDHSKRHGKGPRGKVSIQEVEDAATTPTRRNGAARKRSKEDMDDYRVERMVDHSKRHGKGPRGKASLQDVKASAGTPTPGSPVTNRAHLK